MIGRWTTPINWSTSTRGERRRTGRPCGCWRRPDATPPRRPLRLDVSHPCRRTQRRTRGRKREAPRVHRGRRLGAGGGARWDSGRPRAVRECPYRGLGAFREADAAFFRGRDHFVDRVVASVMRQPVVAVIVGSSGSGKSSAVFAGLIPRLRRTGEWLVAPFRPGPRPFDALAGALIDILEPDIDEADRLVQGQKLVAPLQLGELPVGNVARQHWQGHTETHLLLVVDQAEELYTLCPDPETQRRFLDVLLDAVASRAPHRHDVVLLIALRADFMGHALAHRRFADTLQDSSLLMGPMSRDELRTAIEQPARHQGAAFEAGLVERLLDDVGHEPGHLPMLEFALTLLWDEQVNGLLTHDGYDGSAASRALWPDMPTR